MITIGTVGVGLFDLPQVSPPSPFFYAGWVVSCSIGNAAAPRRGAVICGPLSWPVSLVSYRSELSQLDRLPNAASSAEPVPTGVVYILKSLSTDPAIAAYKPHLYKIGFTELAVEDRIKNAQKDSTFLEAPVKIVATNQCVNLNAQKLEALVHGFFVPRRLHVQLRSQSGKVYTPNEWFNVPLESALAVIKYIVDGSVIPPFLGAFKSRGHAAFARCCFGV
ncbi:MAG: GIY-YIG nuclease family protein [Aeromonas sp.]